MYSFDFDHLFPRSTVPRKRGIFRLSSRTLHLLVCEGTHIVQWFSNFIKADAQSIQEQFSFSGAGPADPADGSALKKSLYVFMMAFLKWLSAPLKIVTFIVFA
jgi:hypothetical protein